MQPVAGHLVGKGIMAQLAAKVEVRIAKGLTVRTHLHPIIIYAEGSENHETVVTAEVAIEWPQALGLEVYEDGIDDLHDIIAAELRPDACKVKKVADGTC